MVRTTRPSVLGLRRLTERTQPRGTLARDIMIVGSMACRTVTVVHARLLIAGVLIAALQPPGQR